MRPVLARRHAGQAVADAARTYLSGADEEPSRKNPQRRARPWRRFLAWDDFLRLGRSAGVYPRRILAGAANGRRA